MIRLAILSANVAVLVALWLDRPKPIKSVQVDYCWIDYLAAGKDQLGNWHKVWASGFGPCALLDRFENI